VNCPFTVGAASATPASAGARYGLALAAATTKRAELEELRSALQAAERGYEAALLEARRAHEQLVRLVGSEVPIP